MTYDILHLPLGLTLADREWANTELNEIHSFYDSVEIAGVYVDAMDFTAMPKMVLVVGVKDTEESK